MQRCVSTVRSALMEFLNYVLVNVSPDRSGAAEFVRGPAEKPRSGSRCWLGEEEGGASRARERGGRFAAEETPIRRFFESFARVPGALLPMLPGLVSRAARGRPGNVQ